ncbi:unnamed protein product [Urochloa humidicola]
MNGGEPRTRPRKQRREKTAASTGSSKKKPTGSLVPSIIKSNSAMNVKTTTGGSNKSKDEIEILLRAREKMKQPGPGGQSHGGSERPRAGLARARRRGGAGRR